MTVADAISSADLLSRDLAGQAIWHGDRCTWIAPVMDPAPPHGVVDGTLSADLYAGVAGVGLALAEAAATLGDPEVRRAARGALRQAVALTARRPLAGGLFGGTAGIAVAVGRGAALLGDEHLHEEGRRLAMALAPADGLDLIDGMAGRIVGLLVLNRVFGDERLADEARATALTLAGIVAGAGPPRRRGQDGDAAPPPTRSTGLAHGRSGIAIALAAAGAPDGAARLLADEDEGFDPNRGWPDARGAGGPPVRSFACAWCHGAAGMLLARHRVREITGAGTKRMPMAPLGIVRRHLEAGIAAVGADLSLCHGLCGLAEASAIVEPSVDARPRVAMLIAGEIADGIPLHCGVPGGHSLGLMTGIAGIVHFLLRLSDPCVPCILVMRPEDWGR